MRVIPHKMQTDTNDAADPGLINSIAEALDGQQIKGSARLKVWLGQSLLQQATVRIDAAAMSHKDILSVLLAHWANSLGDQFGPFAVAYAIQPRGRTVVTTCASRAFIDQIRDFAHSRKLLIQSIAPWNSKILNENRLVIKNENSYFLVREQECVSMGALVDGQWSAWQCEPSEGASWSDIAITLRRFARINALDENMPVWLYPGRLNTSNLAAEGLPQWKILNTISSNIKAQT